MTRALDRTFAAVLFDMDGTLVSSISSVERSWSQLGREFDLPTDDFSALHGIPARAILDGLMADRSAQERERALRRIVEIEVAEAADVTLLPGARENLEALIGAGRCAIVTSCTRELALARLGAAGVPLPEVIVTADDVARGKPDPEPYRTGAARLGVPAADCLVVEDAAAGLDSARAAGAATLAVRTTTAEPVADVVVDDLGQVRCVVTPAGVRVTFVGAM